MKKTTYNEEFIMEHKLIMENWRKYVNERAIDNRSFLMRHGKKVNYFQLGTNIKQAIEAEDYEQFFEAVAEIIIAEAAWVFGEKAVWRATITQSIPVGGVFTVDRQMRYARRIYEAFQVTGALRGFTYMVKSGHAVSYILGGITNVPVIKAMARGLPIVSIAIDLVNIYTLAAEGTNDFRLNTAELALDMVKSLIDKDHYSKLAKDNPGHEEAMRYTTENFDKWDEETQVGWCVRHNKAPDDFEGELTCQVVLDNADPKLIQRAKAAQEKGPAGKTDADFAMAVPAE